MKRTLQKVFSLLLCAAIMVVPGFAAGESGEVTGTPGQSMAAYWCATRGDLADEYRVE